ncbi:MAG: CBS domain-containing protein [Acidimicrobiia bacterium]
MNIADTLYDKPVSDLDLSRYVRVDPTQSVAETIAAMDAAGRSVAFAMEGAQLSGVFTQRDVLMKVIGNSGICHTPLAEVMTPSPVTIKASDSVAEGMAVMTEQWVRSVPVLGPDQAVVGNFSFYTVMHLVSELLAKKAARNESELSAQHGLMFVDLTGLQTTPAVTVAPDDTVEATVHQMKARARGSVMVVDGRHHVVGMLSEFDLQTKVACRRSDLDQIEVAAVMETDPVTLSVRSPVAEAVTTMADHEISHVGLLGESGRLVGMASFREVADYFDSSLAVLG